MRRRALQARAGKRQRHRPRRAAGSRRPLWQSPLTRRILAVNILALVIPVVGLLYLDNYRREPDRVRAGAAEDRGASSSPARWRRAASSTGPLGERAPAAGDHAPDRAAPGRRVADPRAPVRARRLADRRQLPAVRPRRRGGDAAAGAAGCRRSPVLWRAIVGAYDWIVELLPSGEPLPPYSESAVQSAQDYRARCRRRWPARPRPPCAMPAAGAGAERRRAGAALSPGAGRAVPHQAGRQHRERPCATRASTVLGVFGIALVGHGPAVALSRQHHRLADPSPGRRRRPGAARQGPAGRRSPICRAAATRSAISPARCAT